MPQTTKIPCLKKDTQDFILSILKDKRELARAALINDIEIGRATVSDRIKEYKKVYDAYDDFSDYLVDMEEFE